MVGDVVALRLSVGGRPFCTHALLYVWLVLATCVATTTKLSSTSVCVFWAGDCHLVAVGKQTRHVLAYL